MNSDLKRGRWAAGAVALAVAVPLLGAAPARSADSTGTVRFTASADAFVDKQQPGANFGGSARLRTSASKRSYLRFDVGSLPGTVQRATLQVYSTDYNASGFKVAAAPATGWSEGGITWANAPAPGTVVGRRGTARNGAWEAVDVTSLVRGPGQVAMVILPVDGSGSYESTEGGTRRPRLVVETASTTTTTAPAYSETTTTTTASSSTSVPSGLPQGCGTVPQTARQAMFNVLGYAWADGHSRAGGGADFKNGTSCGIARIKADLKMAGIPYTTTNKGDYVSFHVGNVAPFNESFDHGTPSVLSGANGAEIAYFLAGTIEGEGSKNGKVLDDPEWTRIDGAVRQYRRVAAVVEPDRPGATCGCSSDPSYWNVFVDPDAPKTLYNEYVRIIRSFPFAEMSRVPAYR